MTISYAITVCNEFVEIQRLIAFLLENKRNQDEIVVLFDSNNGDKEVETYLRKMNADKTRFKWNPYPFDKDFSEMKNRLNAWCGGNYIFQIDADELPSKELIQHLPTILETNDVDLVRIPRINTVEGLTEGHIRKWGWNVNDKGWVNWPDYQWRIYKNDPRIRWYGHVHEKIIGHSTFSELPMDERFSLYHPKTIDRQEKQNTYYNQL
jgi:hypothetical protein